MDLVDIREDLQQKANRETDRDQVLLRDWVGVYSRELQLPRSSLTDIHAAILDLLRVWRRCLIGKYIYGLFLDRDRKVVIGLRIHTKHFQHHDFLSFFRVRICRINQIIWSLMGFILG
ncbi:unnamed protein product [Eruca vesicaria subsp. sativa]|uniref:Uncharacterized protein n=1 Tax=Eruca vesicaria subsp. sativa TaxID=29727 RepID=A0ABC8L4F0_ERUVS|nr:unnamed protein product [Eruca vesicaria subsp. sativa]